MLKGRSYPIPKQGQVESKAVKAKLFNAATLQSVKSCIVALLFLINRILEHSSILQQAAEGTFSAEVGRQSDRTICR
jgi:hypothetical protein